MNELDDILVQLGRTRFQPKSNRWVTLPELKSDNEFYDTDVPPDQSHSHASVSNLRFRTITKQVRKKEVSRKSKRERIVDKSVLLADRLDRKPL